MDKVIHKDLSYKITGLLYKAHNDLGCYKNEKQYCDYFEFLLAKNNIKFKREKILSKSFDGENPRRNICDFIIENKIVLEAKTKKFLMREDYFQVKRYLSSSDLKLGILVNFRQKYITPKRIINNEIK